MCSYVAILGILEYAELDREHISCGGHNGLIFCLIILNPDVISAVFFGISVLNEYHTIFRYYLK